MYQLNAIAFYMLHFLRIKASVNVKGLSEILTLSHTI